MKNSVTVSFVITERLFRLFRLFVTFEIEPNNFDKPAIDEAELLLFEVDEIAIFVEDVEVEAEYVFVVVETELFVIGFKELAKENNFNPLKILLLFPEDEALAELAGAAALARFSPFCFDAIAY